jgi:hypothetical protein
MNASRRSESRVAAEVSELAATQSDVAFVDSSGAGDAVVYIEDYSADAQTGRLQVRFLNTADTFSVDGVASFYEVTWPDPGLLYAIPEGRNAGVWYARLR